MGAGGVSFKDQPFDIRTSTWKHLQAEELTLKQHKTFDYPAAIQPLRIRIHCVILITMAACFQPHEILREQTSAEVHQ